MEGVYTALQIKLPNKVKVAMYLVYQFSMAEFEFDDVYGEAKM